MRRRNVKNAQSRINSHFDLVIQNPEVYKGKWNTLFYNNNPIYLEIGMGKGKFLLENAINHPDINYIGLEKYNSVIVQAVDKITILNLSNIKLINNDANKIIDFFAPKEIQKIYLNFSDPWPKNRHEKRRLTYQSFLDKYDIILKGDIEFKTDNQGLFEYSLISFNINKWTFLDISLDLHNRSLEEKIITTEYEDKFVAKGNKIYYLKVKK